MNIDKLWELSRAFPPIREPAQQEAEYTALLAQLGVDAPRFYQELEMSTQFVQTHRDVSYNRRDVALHSHGFYEILCCCSTCGMEYLVGTERYRLRRGDIVIVRPGVSHRPIFPEVLPEPYARYVLWVSTEFAERIAPLFPEQDFPAGLQTSLLRTEGTRWEALEGMFAAGVQESEAQGPGWQAAVLGNSLSLLTQLARAIRADGSDRMKAEKPELLDRVLAYAEAHLAEKLTLGEIARIFYVSESTVSQTFRKKMGVSFYRCITQRRLIAAKSLILEGIPLEAVSEQVGFADYSGFYRAFRQEYGISPRQFRQITRVPQNGE